MTADPETKYTFEEFVQTFRGVHTPCEKCRGLGTRWYSSTATWHGGIGGQTGTRDVCDACWGSGDLYNPGYDLRQAKRVFEAEVHKQAQTLLATALGMSFASLNLPRVRLAADLRVLAGKRGREHYYSVLARHLADFLDKPAKES